MRYIDKFEVILLDMMGTFMFGGDRFSDEQDYAATYRNLGGHRLADAEVQYVISQVFNRMANDYGNPAYYEQFPSLSSYLEAILRQSNLPSSEMGLLDEVFALQETGEIPETHAEVMRQLHQTHRLGVVSNIWGRSFLCLGEFRRAGIADLLERTIFSSDAGAIKPSPVIFRRAIEHFGVDQSKVVFVGDDLKYDIAGAQAVGLATVWIDHGKNKDHEDSPRPDLAIKDLRDLLER